MCVNLSIFFSSLFTLSLCVHSSFFFNFVASKENKKKKSTESEKKVKLNQIKRCVNSSVIGNCICVIQQKRNENLYVVYGTVLCVLCVIEWIRKNFHFGIYRFVLFGHTAAHVREEILLNFFFFFLIFAVLKMGNMKLVT